MKIGLLRHFKTTHRFLTWCNSEEYNQEYGKYEESHIAPIDSTDFSKDFTLCYASTAPRALESASLVYKKDIISTPQLMEVPLQALFNSPLRLPIKLWHFINRTAWAFNIKKLPETRMQTARRALRFLSGLLDLSKKEENKSKKILLVTHGFFMVTLQEELRKIGFKGKGFLRPEHGELYEFFL